MGLVRMVRPWNEWLIVWGYDINQPAPVVDEAMATQVARQLVGVPDLEIDLISANTWTVNNCFATHMQKDRVFIMGDAAHRHPPSNGLGSNTSIQDGFNLAWKLAAVVKGQATPKLLDSYSTERAPIARQIVTRANQSIAEFGPIFEALGMDGGVDHDRIEASMAARCDATPAGEAQREALRKAIDFKKYEFDCHGVEMNQRYASGAVVTDGQPPPPPNADMELHYQPTTWPGARLPHVWVYDRSGRQAFHARPVRQGPVHPADRHRRRGLGRGGRGRRQGAWPADPHRHHRPPRAITRITSATGTRVREIGDCGCLLVRPDQHVAWRSASLPAKTRRPTLPASCPPFWDTDHDHTNRASSPRPPRPRSSSAATPRRTNPRLAEVMAVITRHLHAAVKEIEPTEAEWFEAIKFLTATGHMCNDWRQEFILLSDVAWRVDAGRCDQQPQTLGRVGKHRPWPLPRRRRAGIADGVGHLP